MTRERVHILKMGKWYGLHSARAILFLNGFREKSHYCAARYLKEKYVKKKLLVMKWIEFLDHYRDMRHDDQYNMSFFATKKEAEKALKNAQGFAEEMRKLLERLGSNDEDLE